VRGLVRRLLLTVLRDGRGGLQLSRRLVLATVSVSAVPVLGDLGGRRVRNIGGGGGRQRSRDDGAMAVRVARLIGRGLAVGVARGLGRSSV